MQDTKELVFEAETQFAVRRNISARLTQTEAMPVYHSGRNLECKVSTWIQKLSILLNNLNKKTLAAYNLEESDILPL